jgi:Ca2+-binding EF-hand superfamily protein
MKFTKREIAQLYNLFCKADVDLSGTVDMVELLTLLDIERTSFSVRVFSIFDEDKSGLIDFKEFVLAAWNYCTLSDSSLGE